MEERGEAGGTRATLTTSPPIPGQMVMAPVKPNKLYCSRLVTQVCCCGRACFALTYASSLSDAARSCSATAVGSLVVRLCLVRGGRYAQHAHPCSRAMFTGSYFTIQLYTYLYEEHTQTLLCV